MDVMPPSTANAAPAASSAAAPAAAPAASTNPAPAPSAGAAQSPAIPMDSQMQSGEALLVEAYMVIWVLVLGWVFLAWRRTRALEDKMATLEEALARAAKAASPATPAKREPAAKAEKKPAPTTED